MRISSQGHVSSIGCLALASKPNAKLVIRVTAREDGRTLEFMVASNSRLAVTGLLAELRADLVRRQKESTPSAPKIEQSFDGALRERLGTEGQLLDKYPEGNESS